MPVECAVTSVASTSMINGRLAVMSWSGAWLPATLQARARAAARAVSIAANARRTSPASRSITRETVGSEATSPNRPADESAWLARIARHHNPPIRRCTAWSRRTRGSHPNIAVIAGVKAADRARWRVAPPCERRRPKSSGGATTANANMLVIRPPRASAYGLAGIPRVS